MPKFKLKEGELSEKGRKAVNFIKEKASINPFTTGTFVLSSANLATNLSRKKSDSKYQRDQISATKNLTNALTKVDKTIEKTANVTPSKKKKNEERGFLGLFSENDSSMIKFRRKEFSILEDTWKGANIGASIGGLGAAVLPNKFKLKNSKNKISKGGSSFTTKEALVNKYNSVPGNMKKVLSVVGGTIVGAALGALVGTVKELDSLNSRRSIVNDRLMKDILDNLKKNNFKEGYDFTRDPKIADRMKTRVCIVVSRESGDLKVLINTISDPDLKRITEETVNSIKNSSVINKNASNNYNEITISMISDGSADSGLISGICERFIRSGYPVYLVEVG